MDKELLNKIIEIIDRHYLENKNQLLFFLEKDNIPKDTLDWIKENSELTYIQIIDDLKNLK